MPCGPTSKRKRLHVGFLAYINAHTQMYIHIHVHIKLKEFKDI